MNKIRSEIIELFNNKQIDGELDQIKELTGNTIHRMFRVTTKDNKAYAIKILNPKIVIKPGIIENIEAGECLARKLKQKGIPALPAIQFNEKTVTSVGKYKCIMFDWINGKELNSDQVTERECNIIGGILADIHNLSDMEEHHREHTGITIIADWSNYEDKIQEKSWKGQFLSLLDTLFLIDRRALKSYERLQRNIVISHKDLHSKNVLWNDGKPIIIDWESSGIVNPTEELTQVAFYWATKSNGRINPNRFNAVIEAYLKNNRNIEDSIEDAIYLNLRHNLRWLNYNMRRSLQTDGNYEKAERDIAETEIQKVLNEIDYKYSIIGNIVKLVNREIIHTKEIER